MDSRQKAIPLADLELAPDELIYKNMDQDLVAPFCIIFHGESFLESI